MRFSLMRRSYFHNGNDNKKPGVYTGRLWASGERRILWASHPARPCMCVWGYLSGLFPLSFKPHPKGAQQPCILTPGCGPYGSLFWKSSSPLGQPPMPEISSAAILGSQEQHNTDVHSCDEFRFTFNSWGVEMTAGAKGLTLASCTVFPVCLESRAAYSSAVCLQVLSPRFWPMYSAGIFSRLSTTGPRSATDMPSMGMSPMGKPGGEGEERHAGT